MILLDTNVLSALMRQEPDAVVIRWLDRQPRQSVWTTSITVFEVRFGLQIMALGKRRTFLMQAFERLLRDVLEQRIAEFGSDAAQRAADLMAVRQKEGRSGELRDTMIAGIALASHAVLATRNVSHFQDISGSVMNPWLS
ncbi:MAG TPA: type II toxin-antitoxin system VapC family toxin [Acidobacteriaceae bacterium]